MIRTDSPQGDQEGGSPDGGEARQQPQGRPEEWGGRGAAGASVPRDSSYIFFFWGGDPDAEREYET